jgi:hypothetical protein
MQNACSLACGSMPDGHLVMPEWDQITTNAKTFEEGLAT